MYKGPGFRKCNLEALNLKLLATSRLQPFAPHIPWTQSRYLRSKKRIFKPKLSKQRLLHSAELPDKILLAAYTQQNPRPNNMKYSRTSLNMLQTPWRPNPQPSASSHICPRTLPKTIFSCLLGTKSRRPYKP